MSEQEQVTTSEPPPAEIIPAKSEDKLEIEKEEAEKKDQESEEKEEEKTEKKDQESEEEKKEEAKKEEDSAEKEQEKKFKLPKVPGFLRSKSKEREKNKVSYNDRCARLFPRSRKSPPSSLSTKSLLLCCCFNNRVAVMFRALFLQSSEESCARKLLGADGLTFREQTKSVNYDDSGNTVLLYLIVET